MRLQFASELFGRNGHSRKSGDSYRRAIDWALIWCLFTRMCEQRGLTPQKTDFGGSTGDGPGFAAEFLEKLWSDVVLPDTLPVETLGSVYEACLERRITLTGNSPRIELTDGARKSGGVYYTPQYIVDYIVEETVGNAIAGKSPREMCEVRILDPACGTARFLVRVYERIAEEHRRWFEAHPDDAYGDGRLSHVVRLEIVKHCIFGVDIDAMAVEVARLSMFLKLMEGDPAPTLEHQQHSMAILAANVHCGNSLLRSRCGGFYVVLGNPPYGAELSAMTRNRFAKRFGAGTTETAALMMLQASRNLTRAGGVNGFIVPKAFTYSSNWKNIRAELLCDMTSLVDVGKVWPEVRLEQVIYFLHKGAPSKSYTNLRRDGKRFEGATLIDKEHCRRFGFLLNGISREELEVGLKIQNAGSSLSEYVSNTRGAMFQDRVVNARPGRRVIGGKQIRRFHISGEKGFVSSKEPLDANAFVAPENILVQNILAHIENPVDHIRITAAVVDRELAGEIVILDTVNQLANRSMLSPYFFLAILNSRMMNWYVYRFIYAKAIRTMHFDGPVTSRIPVPRITGTNQAVYVEIVREAKALSGQQSLETSEALESAVYRVYRMSTSDVAVIQGGMPGGKRQSGSR